MTVLTKGTWVTTPSEPARGQILRRAARTKAARKHTATEARWVVRFFLPLERISDRVHYGRDLTAV